MTFHDKVWFAIGFVVAALMQLTVLAILRGFFWLTRTSPYA
jgi:mannose/fructose/N-acetylgalactosamine-specific phosphotransferase system component IIC